MWNEIERKTAPLSFRVFPRKFQPEHKSLFMAPILLCYSFSINVKKRLMGGIQKTYSEEKARSFLTPLRNRYVFTRSGGLRLRFIVKPLGAFCTTFCAVAVLGAFTNTSDALHFPGLPQVVAIQNVPAGNAAFALENMNGAESAAAKLAALPAVKPVIKLKPKTEAVEIGRGDTLAGVLQKAGVSGGEAYDIVKVLTKYVDPRGIRPGQKMDLRFIPAGATADDGYQFSGMQMAISPLKTVSLKRMGESFVPELMETEPERRVYTKSAKIEVSLYGSALKAGIPSAVVAEALRVYSWDVDFQRDIRKGDVLDVMYDQMETPNGVKVKSGDILYAKLSVNGQDIPVYRYEQSNGDIDYFTAEGESLRKALMKTPVDGARLSSGFGMRKHPVLGYNKMHKGVDFAAATGTPIYAAGDGTVEKAGKWSSYGNYVRIRHNSSLKTAYAHMNKIASSTTVGARVKQGQIIGYVGMTGRVTGPHLHYEVLVNDAQVSPSSVDLPQGETLKGKELAAFRRHVEKIDREYQSLHNSDKYASLENGEKPSTRLR